MPEAILPLMTVFPCFAIHLLCCCCLWLRHDTITISGRVVDERRVPVAGATVTILHTLDGCVSDSLGAFTLMTTVIGRQVLVVTATGLDTATLTLPLTNDTSGLLIALRSSWRRLNAVTVSAGDFSVADNGRTVLKPMDIMTTAGADADVIRTLQTLPGTQQPGASTGLFVRGGDASEAMVVIDEGTVQNPFFSSLPGVSQSSRFSPFQFKGISFSSGCYPVRYGQALSSVLELNTRDIADNNRISLGANATGVFASGARLWKKNSFECSGSYNNFSPFYRWATTNVDFYSPPTGGGLSLKYVWQPSEKEQVKVLVRGSVYNAGVLTPDPFIAGDTMDFSIRNRLWLASIAWRRSVGSGWEFFTAASYSYNRDDIAWRDSLLGVVPLVNSDFRAQGRFETKKYITSGFEVDAGFEVQHYGYSRMFDTLDGRFTETLPAAYLELHWRPWPWFALRPGIRYEASALTHQGVASPRLSVALRIGPNAQFSLAAGYFYQDPPNLYLLSGYRPSMQEARHVILDYQWTHADRTLRLETYYKSYSRLVREYTSVYDPDAAWRIVPQGRQVDNSGYGYARGAELFWHDKSTLKGFDYWVSYSYIDTRRLYEDYLKEATPDYVAAHNLSVVTRYFVDKWQTNFSLTFSYASGRPYYDPASSIFLGARTPPFNDLSLAVGRLATVKKWFTVIYLGVGNITDHHNLFGYRYSYDGARAFPILPAVYRSVLLGVNISRTRFDKSEL